ncbi:MAG TPA: hypothetical protein VGH19_12415 [Verrucomicrobiae bacterium]
MESELNRIECCNELATLKQEVSGVVEEGRSLINTAGFVVAGFRAVRSFYTDRKKDPEAGEQPGIFSLLLRMIMTGASIWKKQDLGKD